MKIPVFPCTSFVADGMRGLNVEFGDLVISLKSGPKHNVVHLMFFKFDKYGIRGNEDMVELFMHYRPWACNGEISTARYLIKEMKWETY